MAVGSALGLLAAACGGAGVGLAAWGLLGRRDQLSRYAEILDAYSGPAHQAPKATLEERVGLALAQAGWNLSTRELAGLWATVAVVVAVVFSLLARRPLAGVILGPVGAAAGIWWGVSISRLRRRRLVDEQLMRVLFSLSGMLQAGRRPDSALEEAAKTVGAPLEPELSWAVRQYRVGVEMPKALRMAAARLGSRELEQFATAVEVNEEKGGDIVNVLGKLAASIADHIALRGQQSALLAEVQLTRYVASVAPIGSVFMLWIASPSTLQLLFRSATGVMMLVGASLLWAAGFVVMNRMLKPLRDAL